MYHACKQLPHQCNCTFYVFTLLLPCLSRNRSSAQLWESRGLDCLYCVRLVRSQCKAVLYGCCLCHPWLVATLNSVKLLSLSAGMTVLPRPPQEVCFRQCLHVHGSASPSGDDHFIWPDYRAVCLVLADALCFQ